MLGQRLAVNRAMAGLEPTWLLPTDYGPLSAAEVAARAALGEPAWRYWVGRGWYSVQE
jgi:hypothetical protein